MARRVIDCLIWNDDKFPYVSDDCQLVFFHVMTTPLSSPFGLYKASLEMLASEKRWPVKRYAKGYREGYAKGFLKYDEKAQVLLIPNFVKYNLPDNPKVLQSWGKIYQEIPDSPLKTEFYHILKGYLERYRKGYLIQYDILFPIPSRDGIGYPFSSTLLFSDSSLNLNLKEEGEEGKEGGEGRRGEEEKGGKGEEKKGNNKTKIDIDGREYDWPSPAALVALYNHESADELPAVEVMSPGRIEKAKEYLGKFPSLEFWREVFAETKKSLFLRGLKIKNPGHKGFKGDFDWLLTKGKDHTENCVKVKEGKYRE